jgi:hypothetical protein
MIRAVRFAVPMIAVAFALVVAPSAPARAADAKVVAEIEGHDKAFLAAYENGETKKMKSEIAKAVSLGEKNGLGADPVMADTYVLAAILDVDGNEDAKAGVRDFVKALKIRPDVAIPKGMATSPVKAALKQARVELGLAPKDGAAATAVAAAPAAKPAEAPKESSTKESTKESTKSEAPPEKSDKAAEKTADVAAEKARAEAQAKQQQEQKDKQAREDRDRQEKEKQAQDKQQKELAQKDKASKADSDKQSAELKGRVRELEKDKADRDKQLADKDKQLGEARARIQQLEKDKADRDKQLADGRAHNQQLERERSEKDKQLADARAQASKDREALDKIARDKQAAEAQLRDAENKRKQEQEQRDRLFAGPEMPSRLSEALTCAVPDEAPLRADLFVHCVARPNVKARSIVFYYRTGSAHYYSVPMERTAKGWYAAVVPAVRVTGKVLQYYAEALDGRESVVAKNGKETSPNILTLRPGVPRG